MGQPQIPVLNGATPAAPPGYVNARWQQGSSLGPDPTYGVAQIPDSCYVPSDGIAVVKTANYTLSIADLGKLIIANSASPITFTLPNPVPLNALSSPTTETRWKVRVANIGTGTLTLAHNSLQIDGAAADLNFAQFTGAAVFTDGANYFTVRGASAGGGGGLNGAVVKTAAYTAVSGDNGKLLSFNASSAVTLTLPSASPSPTWSLFVQNISANNLTLNPNGLQLDGSTSNLTIPPGNGLTIFTDGTNYFTERGMSDKPVWFPSFVPGLPAAGQEVGKFVAPATCTFPGNFSSPNAVGQCDVNPTATANYNIYKNGSTLVGNISISTSGVFTFTTVSGAAVSLNAGDWLTAVAPGTQDATLAGVAFMLVGSRASVATVLTPIQFFTWRGTYSNSTAYNVNDVVFYHGASYVCTTPTTGNTPLNASFWQMMADGWQWQGAYSGGTTYFPNDVVSSSGSSYLCILTTTGNAPPNATYWALVAQAGGVTSLNTLTGALSIVGAGAISVGAAGSNITISGGGATYGPRASLPGTVPAAGTEYVCSDSPFRYISNGTAWQSFYGGVPVSEPPTLTILPSSPAPTAGSTVDYSKGGLNLQGAFSGNDALYGLTKPAGSTWNALVGFMPRNAQPQFNQVSLYLYDSGSGKLIYFTWFAPWNAGKTIEITKWSSITTFNSSYTILNTGGTSTVQAYGDMYRGMAGLVWFHIAVSSTNIKFYQAHDPWNTYPGELLLSTTLTDWLPAITHVGVRVAVGATNNDTGMWLIHWAVA